MIGWWLWNGVNQRRGWCLWLRLGMRKHSLGQGWRLRMDLGLRLLLYLNRGVVGRVLELGGSRSVLTEATGLSGAVDLTQSVQCFTLSVLQQVGLAL